MGSSLKTENKDINLYHILTGFVTPNCDWNTNLPGHLVAIVVQLQHFKSIAHQQRVSLVFHRCVFSCPMQNIDFLMHLQSGLPSIEEMAENIICTWLYKVC